VEKASNEAISKSADVTAELAGTSRAKVEKIRVITNLLAGEVATGEGLSGRSEKRLSVARMRGMSVFALLWDPLVEQINSGLPSILRTFALFYWIELAGKACRLLF
jgi:hypothetical protein